MGQLNRPAMTHLSKRKESCVHGKNKSVMHVCMTQDDTNQGPRTSQFANTAATSTNNVALNNTLQTYKTSLESVPDRALQESFLIDMPAL